MIHPYELRRSSRKTLAIEITRDGKLIVRAPNRMPIERIERFVSEQEQWISSHLTRAEERARAHPEPTPEEEKRLREAAKELLPQRVSHYAALMGLTPTGIKITGAKTRFGSCSAKNSLCFSFRLMQYPMEAIDYVVVHELSHIVHKNHGPHFYKLIASVLPDYKQRQNLLKR